MSAAHLEVDDPGWRAALARLPHDFYHLPEYSKLEGATQAAQPRAFGFREGDREVFLPYLLRSCAPLFPDSAAASQLRDVVSPYGYPGLLLSDAARQSPEFVRRAMQQLSETLREQGVVSAFLRMHPLLSDGFAALFPEGFFTAPSETVAIDLTLDEATLWKNLRDGHQWVIKKCRKLGFQPRMVPFSEHIEAFMEVYQDTMNRVHAKDSYYFGQDYFDKLAALPKNVHCCLVDFAGEPVAACVFFECGGIVQAHLGGTKSEFLSKSPFHLALYHAAEWAKSRGNRYFHLGGGVGGEQDRLLQFKLGFSARTFPFFTLRMITDEANYRALTALGAQAAGVPLEDRLQNAYFPAYRAAL